MTKFVSTWLSLSLLLSGCGILKKNDSNLDDNDSSSSSSYSYYTEYNDMKTKNDELTKKFNKLLTASHELESATFEESRLIIQVDDRLKEFTESAQEFSRDCLIPASFSKSACDLALSTISIRKSNVSISLSFLEVKFLEVLKELDENVDFVYMFKDDNHNTLSKYKTAMALKGNKLDGVRRLLDAHQDQLDKQYRAKLIATNQPPPTPAQQSQITLRPEEKQIAGTQSSGGVVRSSGGQINVLSNHQQVVDYAKQNGFNATATEAGYKMSSQTGGLIAFATDNKTLPKAISDMFSHMKGKINNTDDLEVAFVIDYSGSMSDDIDGVIKGLVEIVKDLENVRQNRNVKIAVLTFGAPGKEKVNLDFTSNLVTVRYTLESLLQNYSRDNHSTDPGEASYHGLELASKMSSWSSRNRMAIVITDEPAWELEQGGGLYQYGQKFVDGVFSTLKKGGIQTSIYTIIVK